MKITKETEELLIKLFESSKKEDYRAKKTVELINYCFYIISVFTNTNHNEVFKNLYFTNDNLFNVTVAFMINKCSTSESKLKRDRDRYCIVADAILKTAPLLDFINLTEKT